MATYYLTRLYVYTGSIPIGAAARPHRALGCKEAGAPRKLTLGNALPKTRFGHLHWNEAMTNKPKRKIVRSPNRNASTSKITKEKLISAVTELLNDHFPEQITGEMILEKSSVSRGSLYHHFDDVSDLMEQALVRKFASHVDESNKALTTLIEDSASGEEMLTNLLSVTRVIHSPENSSNRIFRARIISLAESNERLTQLLSKEQKRLTDTIIGLFKKAQDKGWMKKDFDPAIASIFIQAYTLGRVIDDIAEEKIDPDAWNAFINKVIRTMFC